MPSIETILSPSLIQYHSLVGRTAVIIDVLRATSSMCHALHEGAIALVPVESPAECSAYAGKGFLCAAERNGIRLEGFDMGNSPEEFNRERVQGREIAITTTNGTYALLESQSAERIYIGSFLNLQALAERLRKEEKDVSLVCAGWKNKVNLEDTLFAGALASLLDGFESECDSTLMARLLWESAKPDPVALVERSSHARRFNRLGIDDLPACMAMNRCPVIPEYISGRIVVSGE